MSPDVGDVYDEPTHNRRVGEMRIRAALIQDELICAALALATGADAQLWSDRIYGRLEHMSSHDLALLVVVILNDGATREANRLWSQLWTCRPEDVT